MSHVVTTFCRICVAGCGLEVTVDRERNKVMSIEPDRQNPYTWGDFCRKGKTAAEVVEHPRRITTPMKRVGDRYVRATYDEAITDIARRLGEVIDRHGPDAVGTYHGNPMGFSFSTTTWWTGLLDAIGTGNRYWVGSIDQNNGHVVAQALYGVELVSLVPDIDESDCFLLVGMDPAVSKFNWMENNPRGWQRVLKRQAAGADVIVVDPRRSATARNADTHVAVLPGRDWAFLLGLVKVILDRGLERLSTTLPIEGVDDLRRLVAEADLDDLAARCGVDATVISDVARRFAGAHRAMCVCHTGVSQNEMGTVGEWLSHVLNLITDRTDRPGGRRFERGVIDIPKVMSLFAPASVHRTRVRGLPAIVGFHSLSELPEEITTPGDGRIRAMMIAFGNPVVSGPDGRALDEALEQLDFLVAIDLVQRESHRHADWLIPGTHWLERAELSPLFASLQEQPYIHYGAQALAKPEGVMEEWEFFEALALKMGRNLFGRPGVNIFVKVMRKLAGWTGRPGLAMNPNWVSAGMIKAGRRVKYRDVLNAPHGLRYARKRYGDLAGIIAHPGGAVRIAPPAFLDATRAALRDPTVENTDYPFLLTGKRVREAMNSWLNESPGLTTTRANPLEMHPDDADRLGIGDGDQVRVTSPLGSIELTVELSERIRPGVVACAHGWGGGQFDPAGGGAADRIGVNRNLLVDNRRLDPLSQTPAFNSTAVRVEPVRVVSGVPEREEAAR
ncbi:molybdopterin-containing oxidoreductase family protein [Pseudonocardia spinosispora]|uniref:molybdopterin-containing oxidoreductase family protein n=1 Tax=Pseudonocardia spinosispora TaxID=103441 RepID=UPI00068818EC|nr:molybdopterin-dependent oxidoreductase [Pseudonocardia spinosispora]